MITSDDVRGVAEFLKKELTQNQVDEVIRLYPSEQKEDPSAEWYLVVEKIIYDITN